MRRASLRIIRTLAPPARCQRHQKGAATMQQPDGYSARRAEARPVADGLGQTGSLLRCTMALALVMTLAGLLGSCATAPATREDKATLVAEATSRWQQMRATDPSLGALVQRGYGHA